MKSVITPVIELERHQQHVAGKAVANALHHVHRLIKQGERNVGVLNQAGEDFLFSKGAYPSCLGYTPSGYSQPYAHGMCISVNDVVAHGVPSYDQILKDGDIVTLDLVGRWHGWHADAAITVGVGKISDEAQRLIDLTKQALDEAIPFAQAGNRTGLISNSIRTFAQKHNLGIAIGLYGHGIGESIHCAPAVHNEGHPESGAILQVGDSICIEPMFTLGTRHNHVTEDGWTVKTDDGSLAAHFEHTILIGTRESQILTEYLG